MRFELVRPDDLLHLIVETTNARVDSADPSNPVLVAEDESRPARLVVTLPPQTIAESAIFESSTIPPDVPPSPPPIAPRPDPDPTRETIPPPGTPRQGAARVARLARPSRLVFELAPGERLPLSVAGLLEWSRLRLRVAPNAALPARPSPAEIAAGETIREPRTDETALELPSRLWISPNAEATWDHRIEPFTARGRTEVWHTRLVPGPEDGEQPSAAPLRALWSPDYRPGPPPSPGNDADLSLAAMNANDRHQIVVLTSAFRGYERMRFVVDLGFGKRRPFVGLRPVPYVPEPFRAELLMLSPLGAWLRSRGAWYPPPRSVAARPIRFEAIPDVFALLQRARPPRDQEEGDAPQAARVLPPAQRASAALSRYRVEPESHQLDLSEWVHRATQGRDHYVRIVYEGLLLPYELEASLVKVTERKAVEADGVVQARLFQRMFIVVRQPERSFPRTREMPFAQVRVTTLVTPDIAQPSYLEPEMRSFWVEVVSGGAEVRFPFHVVGTRVDGSEADFTIPMLFVSISDANDGARRRTAYGGYNASRTDAEIRGRQAIVPGHKVLFARTADDTAPVGLNSELVTRALNFVVDESRGPRLLFADVDVPQVRELLGKDAPATIRFFADYVASGLDGTNGVFAEIARVQPGPDLASVAAPAELPLEFDANQAGGFATPNMGVRTLSTTRGPLGATPAQAVADTFDPATFFAGTTANLFGTFPLAQLVLGGTLGADAPTLTTRRENGTLLTELEWIGRVRERDLTIAKFSPGTEPGPETRLEVRGTLRRPLDEKGSSFNLEGTLNDFEVALLGGAVVVRFARFRFTERSGAKPSVDVDLQDDPIAFGGDLRFVEELRNAIPAGLFGEGPFVDLTDSGIRAGFAFALPPLEVGVFALKDVALGAAVTLPFADGKPALDFNFSSREHPFQLAVLIFGGGGFFHLQVDAGGMKQLEAALEFGAVASLNLGVASGSVHMLAGIYFALERRDPGGELDAILSGYLRVGGSLRVLAIVTVTVEFNLSFTWVEAKQKAYGRATLTVHVDVLLFSTSVSLTVEKAFGGTSDDPTFLDQFASADLWDEYAGAFA